MTALCKLILPRCTLARTTCIVLCAIAIFAISPLVAAHEALSEHFIDRESISVSGFSSGGFMAAQLGIAYSDLFKVGFGVFAGGPFDCARNQHFHTCMYNNTPSMERPQSNMCAWSGREIDCLCNLKRRRIFMQAGSEDDVIGLGITKLLAYQLAPFTDVMKVKFVTSVGAGHTFPANRDSAGNSGCNESRSPYISNCGYDGAGDVLNWLYENNLWARNTGLLSGSVVPFAQTGSLGAPGLAEAGYMYVPEACRIGGPSRCRLHVALHGCTMNYELLGDKFVMDTGYNEWADANDMIIVYPQTTADNATYLTWSGRLVNNQSCFDWIGQYGDSDRKGGLHMEAIVNMVNRIAGTYSR